MVQLTADGYRFTQAAARGANIKSLVDNDETELNDLSFWMC